MTYDGGYRDQSTVKFSCNGVVVHCAVSDIFDTQLAKQLPLLSDVRFFGVRRTGGVSGFRGLHRNFLYESTRYQSLLVSSSPCGVTRIKSTVIIPGRDYAFRCTVVQRVP